ADCDLRRPSQHAIWGFDREPGLTTMILEGLEVPPLAAPGIEGLTVLPSGPLPPNPADLVGSPRMESIINRLTERADYVLFDAPPVFAVTDAALRASRLDGVLLVLRAGGTRRDHAERARELLERIGVRIVGAVLLDAEVDGRVGGYYGE
ncbi:MAG: CpsD/CapB family tyrosine-protein kinase, partial [Anaerolineae bacterium]